MRRLYLASDPKRKYEDSNTVGSLIDIVQPLTPKFRKENWEMGTKTFFFLSSITVDIELALKRNTCLSEMHAQHLPSQ